jgi:hypothetical protein
MLQAIEQPSHQWDDKTALHWLGGNFRWPGGMIRARPGYKPTDLDLQAIAYLCDEWDFAWEGVPA